jgi:spermidine/putrescine transport system permease protein
VRIARPSSLALPLHSAAVYIFLYAPIAILILFSFNREKQTAVWKGFTLDWYTQVLSNQRLMDAMWNSLIVGALATGISTILGTMAALALSRYRFRLKGTTQGLLYLPIVIPEIVAGVSLMSFFGLLGWRGDIATVSIAHITFCISYVAIVVKSRLAGFDYSLEEAAADLGAPPRAVFLRVKLPLMMPGIVAGALLAFTISVDDYLITSLVCGPESTTFPVAVYSILKTGSTPEVNAASSILLAFTVILVLVAQRLLRR